MADAHRDEWLKELDQRIDRMSKITTQRYTPKAPTWKAPLVSIIVAIVIGALGYGVSSLLSHGERLVAVETTIETTIPAVKDDVEDVKEDVGELKNSISEVRKDIKILLSRRQ